MTERTLFVFPGQGAQYVGMCHDIFNEFAVARHTFERVSDLTHRDMRRICMDGPVAELNHPENTSLATFTHSVSIAHVLQSECGYPLHEMADAMVGHSMGQYSALYCVGSMKFQDAVSVLAARSNYMSLASTGGAGMIAIVGLSQEMIDYFLRVAQPYGYAEFANYNARDQFVISGQNAALDVILDMAVTAGARIARRLNIAVPAHCGLMAQAGVMLQQKLDGIHMSAPQTTWFSNQTAHPMLAPADIKQSLVDQMTCGVRWVQIMENLPKYKITRAYELGPGRVLSRLIQRAKVGVRAVNTDTLVNLRAVMSELQR
ncbi:MAG: ACP S-malonyltransferase [Muribaculaceae bacterium]|nr:ACP S-malonyltransferase [Muribaculaceae bacterium]